MAEQGNVAALRVTLESMSENLAIHIQCGRFVAPGDHVSFPISEAEAYIRDIRAALDAPARNCDRLRDLVRRMIPGVDEVLAIAKAEGESIKGLCALRGVDSSEVDKVLEKAASLLREAREAVGESMKEGGEE